MEVDSIQTSLKLPNNNGMSSLPFISLRVAGVKKVTVVDDVPGRRETHKGVGSLPCDISNKPVYASPGCHYGGV
jgi:hypothetical protein